MENKTNEITTGERLEDLLKERGITLEELATAIGVSKGSVSSWINGKSDMRAQSLRNIAEYFDVSADYLLGLSDIPLRQNIELQRLGLSNVAICTLQKMKQISDLANKLSSGNSLESSLIRALKCTSSLLESWHGVSILSMLETYISGYKKCELRYTSKGNSEKEVIELRSLRKELLEERLATEEGDDAFSAPIAIDLESMPDVQVYFDDCVNGMKIDDSTFERIVFLELQQKIEDMHCLTLAGADYRQSRFTLQEHLDLALCVLIKETGEFADNKEE